MDLDPLYSYSDYKKYLADQIDKNETVRGYKSLLAEAAQCQRSFMSQVLNGHVHITPDHAIGLAAFWRMDTEATEFFLELVHFGRAATPHLRAHLERRLKALRIKQRDASVRIDRPELEKIEHQSVYYSHWYWTALHMLVGIKGYNTERMMSERLHLPMDMVKQGLTVLQNMGLVAKDKNGWMTTNKSIHAAAGSIHSWLHHDSWRSKASESIRKRDNDAFHFTSVYTLSTADKAKIQDLVMQLMDKVERVVGPSPEEDMACLCIDWFDV